MYHMKNFMEWLLSYQGSKGAKKGEKCTFWDHFVTQVLTLGESLVNISCSPVEVVESHLTWLSRKSASLMS